MNFHKLIHNCIIANSRIDVPVGDSSIQWFFKTSKAKRVYIAHWNIIDYTGWLLG